MPRRLVFLAAIAFGCQGDILPAAGEPPAPSQGEPMAGAQAAGGGDAESPATPAGQGGTGGSPGQASTTTCTLRLTELAVYQGVKITVAKDGAAVQARTADVIAHRAATVRAFVQPQNGWSTRDAEAKLTVSSAAGTMTLSDRRPIAAESKDGDLASTFNFDVSPAALTGDAKLQVTLVDPADCTASPQGQLPSDAGAPLAARKTGIVKVHLVPIAYGADASDRLPDTTDTQLKRYRELLAAMYPVEDVMITVRQPVRSTTALAAGSGWPMTLDALRALRAQDAAADDVYYYGLVTPAATIQQYCGNACTAGIAYVAPSNDPRQRVGLGIGYPLLLSAMTMAHELGHEHGRKHAPCGSPQPADADSDFPHAGAGVSAWGWDARTKTLLDPAGRRDIMGYCNPQWISDYTYQALATRSAFVNTSFSASQIDRPVTRALTVDAQTPWADAWWVLIVGADGSARWGLPVEGKAAGVAEEAIVRDASGQVVAKVPVFRTELGEEGWASIMVSPPKPGWASIEVPGAQPHDYNAPTAVRPLE